MYESFYYLYLCVSRETAFFFFGPVPYTHTITKTVCDERVLYEYDRKNWIFMLSQLFMGATNTV